LCAVTGITNRSPRALTGLPGAPYGMSQASYDLARLRRNGLITRRPHSNTYDLAPDGLAFAIFYTKVCDRVLAPLFAAGQPQSPPQFRAALNVIEHHINERLAAAGLPVAACETQLNCQSPSDKGSLGRLTVTAETHSPQLRRNRTSGPLRAYRRQCGNTRPPRRRSAPR
jgi:hypothetical protein